MEKKVTKGTKVTIEIVRTDGGFQAASLYAVDACYDEGFVAGGKSSPAVKIIREVRNTTEPYFLVGTCNPVELTVLIKNSIMNRQKLHLPYNIFDPAPLSYKEAYEKLILLKIPKNTLQMLIDQAPKKAFLNVIGSKNFPLTAAHVFARSLPTIRKPDDVSKHQYFKFLIQQQ